MKIIEYMAKDMALTGMKPEDKNQVCEALVDLLIKTGKISKDRRKILIDKLLEREALCTTGIGGGVAIPHAAGENIKEMLIVVGQIPEGVEFDSVDGEPVKLVFMIIGSEKSARAHLQALASIVRVAKHQALVEKLLNADSPDKLYCAISDFCGG